MIADTLLYMGFSPDDFEVVLSEKGELFIAEWRSKNPRPTLKEIEDLYPTVVEEIRLNKLTEQQAKEQQNVGIAEAKKAYIRLQTIIDGVDTATIVQLRAAIKTLARDVQHLIHATIK